MTYLHACIFAKYADLSGVIDVWQTKCDSLCVVEHPPEGKTKRIHCHFLIENTAQEDWFRDQAKKVMGDYIKRGNYWIASRVQKGEYAGEPISRTRTLIYILKGKFSVSFAKNFSEQEVEEARQAWIDSDKNDSTARLSPTQKMIEKVSSEFDWLKSRDDLPTESSYLVGVISTDSWLDQKMSYLFAEVRGRTCKVFLRETHQMPHPSQYKIVVSTVFVRIMERIKYTNNGLRFMLDKWY